MASSNSLRVRLLIERLGAPALHWYSARLRLAILTDRRGLERFLDSVILLRAETRDQAFEQALAQGRQREQSYCNESGLHVRWRLASVVSLDELPEANLHGAEVLSMPTDPGQGDTAAFGWDHDFRPELSIPEETRV